MGQRSSAEEAEGPCGLSDMQGVCRTSDERGEKNSELNSQAKKLSGYFEVSSFHISDQETLKTQ